MNINRKRCLHLLGAAYLLYMIFYLNISHLLPSRMEMRSWASVLAILTALGGGVVVILLLLLKLRTKMLGRMQKKAYVDFLIGAYSLILLIGIGIFADSQIDRIPQETVAGDGKLIVSVRESEDSMRMYYCEPINAVLRRPLSDEELRAEFDMDE